MKTNTIFIFLILAFQLTAQKLEVEFGQVTMEDLQMENYSEDSDAKAVILFDKGKSTFFYTDKGYNIRFTRHKRIKIFDKTTTQHTEISIPYFADGYGKTEVVKSIEAATYNLEHGHKIKKSIHPSSIFTEKVNERYFNKKFTFSDVQNGSVLELKYVIETPFLFNLPDWRFQDKIPTIYSEYEVAMIPFYEYEYFVQGISRFDQKYSVRSKEIRAWGKVVKAYGREIGKGFEFQDMVYTYILKDIPAFKDESYITSINDYIIKMDFQLARTHDPEGGSRDIISTWSELNKSLLKHDDFGKYLKGCFRFAKKTLVEDLNISALSSDQKTQKIVEFIKKGYTWNGHKSKYASMSPKDFYTRKTGNSADINLFLLALLQTADINAQPIILSTRDHGKILTEYPFDHLTNYIIVLVNTNSPFLADATEHALPFNRLPIRCFNEIGLVVENNDDITWLKIKDSTPSSEKTTITMALDEQTLKAGVDITIQSTEYMAFSNRNKFQNNEDEVREYYTENVDEISKITISEYGDLSKPHSINLVGSIETEEVGNSIILTPFLGLPLSKNPFTLKKRTYPIDFTFSWQKQYESSIRIPDGYIPQNLPDKYEVQNDLVEIKLEYTSDKEHLLVNGKYLFKKAIYDPNEYSRIKYYLDQITEKFNESIILQKVVNKK